jgi:hypothetical protein
MAEKDTKKLKRKERRRKIFWVFILSIYIIFVILPYQWISSALILDMNLSDFWGILVFVNNFFLPFIFLPAIMIKLFWKDRKTKFFGLKFMYLISVLFVILMNIVFLFLDIFIFYIEVPRIKNTITNPTSPPPEVWAWTFLGVIIVTIIIVIYLMLSYKLLTRIYPEMKNPITKFKGKRPITRRIIAEEIEEFER